MIFGRFMVVFQEESFPKIETCVGHVSYTFKIIICKRIQESHLELGATKWLISISLSCIEWGKGRSYLYKWWQNSSYESLLLVWLHRHSRKSHIWGYAIESKSDPMLLYSHDSKLISQSLRKVSWVNASNSDFCNSTLKSNVSYIDFAQICHQFICL